MTFPTDEAEEGSFQELRGQRKRRIGGKLRRAGGGEVEAQGRKRPTGLLGTHAGKAALRYV